MLYKKTFACPGVKHWVRKTMENVEETIVNKLTGATIFTTQPG